MARGARVHVSSSGAQALLAGAAVQADLMARAERIAATANAGTSPDDMANPPYMAVDASGSRARARVITSSPHGIRDNNKHNTLLKSLDAGR